MQRSPDRDDPSDRARVGLAPEAGGRRAALWLAAGGASAGLAMYTYHTGRLAPLVVEECRTVSHQEPWLTLLGLEIVFERNT